MEALQALPLSSSHAERAGSYSGICPLGCLLFPQGGRHPGAVGICSGTASHPPRRGPGVAIARERSRQAEQTPRSPLLCPRPHLAVPALGANNCLDVTRVGRELLPWCRAKAAAGGGEGCEPEQRSWAPAGGKLAATAAVPGDRGPVSWPHGRAAGRAAEREWVSGVTLSLFRG